MTATRFEKVRHDCVGTSRTRTTLSRKPIEHHGRSTWDVVPLRQVCLSGVQDTDGNVIAQGHAEAQSNWMTEDFVPYIATLTFVVPAGVTDGVLYLRKDNPSGLPANDDEAFPCAILM